MKILIELLENEFFADKQYQVEGSTIQMLNLQKYSDRIVALSTSGIYILLGVSVQHRQIYIGQTMNLSRRLKEHQKGKDFWCECLCFFDQMRMLTKTEVEWLEQELIKSAISSNFYDVLTNFQIPKDVVINELDEPRLNEIFQQIKLLLNVFGCPIVAQNCSREGYQSKTSNAIIDRIAKSYLGEISKKDPYLVEDDDGIFHIEKDGVNASYMDIGAKFMIFKNSNISPDLSDETRKKLLEKFEDKIENFVLIKDIIVETEKDLKLLIG